MTIRKGSKVSHSIHGGLWEVITRETPMTVFADCPRFTLRNIETREYLKGVRDKDVITKNNPLFTQFTQFGE